MACTLWALPERSPPPPAAAAFFFGAASCRNSTPPSFMSHAGNSSNAASSAHRILCAQVASSAGHREAAQKSQEPVLGSFSEELSDKATTHQSNSEALASWSGNTGKIVDGFGRREAKRSGRKWIRLRVDDEAVEILKKQINNEQEVFKTWKRPLTSATIATIIDGVCDWRKAYTFFEWLKMEDHHEITKYVYGVMLKSLRRGKQWALSENLVEEMISKGLQVDNITYSTLISCAKRCYLPEMALKWFDRMLAAGCTPDEITCSSMIDVYGAAGRIVQAKDLYRRLRQSGWKLDPVAFGAMANVYARVGDFKAIKRLFWDMKQLGFEPNVISYTSYIQALCNADKPSLAMDALNQMKHAGIKPTSVTFGILIEMHSRLGAVDDAFAVFRQMQQEDLNSDAFVCNALISACVENSLVTEAEEVFCEMEKKGPTPDEVTYRRMVSVYASAGRADKAAEFLDKLLEKGYEPTIDFCQSLVKTCREAQQSEKLPLYLEEMINRGCKADQRLLGVLLDCFGMCKGNVTRERLLSCLEQISATFHALVMSLLIKDTDSSGLGEDLKVAFDDIPERYHKSLCNKLINMCMDLGYAEKSRQIFEAGASRGIYKNIQVRSEFEWQLDLRGLSILAAQCAVNSWVNSLSLALEKGEPMPSRFIVETGKGKKRETTSFRRRIAGQTTLNATIPLLLKELDAPFEGNPEAGALVASLSAMKTWLYSRKVSHQLI